MFKDHLRLEEDSQIMKLYQVGDTNSLPFPTRVFGTMGAKSITSLACDDYDYIDSQYIRNASFYPYKMDVSDPNNPVLRLNPKDAMLLDLKSKYNSQIVNDVLRAVKELDTWNPSGRYPVIVPWNQDSGKPITKHQIIKHMLDLLT